MGRLYIDICTPHNNLFPAKYVDSLRNTLCELNDRYRIGVNFAESPYIHVNRNKLMLDTQLHGADFLLFIDSDMVWRPADIDTLVKFDRDVVGGLYMTRTAFQGKTHVPVVYRYNEKKILVPVNDYPNTVFKCDAIGTGFLLLKRKVVDNMIELIPQNGFPFDPVKLPEERRGIHAICSDYYGEDISFCETLTRSGFNIWCHPGVKLGHLVNLMVTPQ